MAPKGWRVASLGETATLQRGFDLPVHDRREGRILVVASNGPVGTHAVAQVEGPGVVTGRSGTIGKVFFYDSAFWPLNTTLYVSDFHGNDPRFIARLLSAMGLEKYAASTGVPSLNRNFVHPIPVLVPPLPEQRKIAAILSSVDAAIEATQAVIDQLDVVKKAMMAELLTRGLPGRHTRFKRTEIGEMPDEWEVTSLENMCSEIVDCPHSTPAYVSSGFPVIRTADVVPGRILIGQAKQVSEETLCERTKRLVPIPGDIFYSREGERFGIAAPVPEGVRTCVGQRMMHLRASLNDDASFVCSLMNSSIVYDQAVAAVGGSTSPHVNVGSVRAFLVPRPGREEQIEVGRILDAHEGRLEAEVGLIAGLRGVKDSLMSVLLTGEVRVTFEQAAA